MLGEQITRFIPRFKQKPIDSQAQARREIILEIARERGSFSFVEARKILQERKIVSAVADSLVVHDIYTLLAQRRLEVRHKEGTRDGIIPEFSLAQNPREKPTR